MGSTSIPFNATRKHPRKSQSLRPLQKVSGQGKPGLQAAPQNPLWSDLAELLDEVKLVAFAVDGIALGGSEITEDDLRPVRVRMTDVVLGLSRLVDLIETEEGERAPR